VIGNSQCAIRRPNDTAIIAQAFKSLRACHFMNKVPVNIDQAGAIILLMHNMRIPDFIK
jgi:hypothetical protein